MVNFLINRYAIDVASRSQKHELLYCLFNVQPQTDYRFGIAAHHFQEPKCALGIYGYLISFLNVSQLKSWAIYYFLCIRNLRVVYLGVLAQGFSWQWVEMPKATTFKDLVGLKYFLFKSVPWQNLERSHFWLSMFNHRCLFSNSEEIKEDKGEREEEKEEEEQEDEEEGEGWKDGRRKWGRSKYMWES